MPRKRASRLSVVLVTYNSGDAVAAALPALCEQLEPDDELVVVDNASADDTRAVVRELAPDAIVVESRSQHRLRGGRQRRRPARERRSAGVPEPRRHAASGVRGGHPRRARPRLGGVDGPGDPAGRPRGQHERRRRPLHRHRVGGRGGRAGSGHAGRPARGGVLSGACLAVPRDVVGAGGRLREAFFMYQEDVDLSLRLRLAGGRLGVEPAAVVDHDYEFAKGPAKWRMLERNRWAMIVRCYPSAAARAARRPRCWPPRLALLVVAAAGGWLPQKLPAALETARALPRLLRERRAVQATRTISPPSSRPG